MPLGTEILSQNICQYKAWFFQSSVGHLDFADEYLVPAYPADTTSLNFFFFVLFKRVCTLLCFWEQDFLQIHLRPTIYACGFCSESKCTTLPFSFSTKSQVYQRLLPRVECHFYIIKYLSTYFSKYCHRSIFSAARFNFQYSIRWLVVLYLFHIISPLLPIRRPALSWVRY